MKRARLTAMGTVTTVAIVALAACGSEGTPVPPESATTTPASVESSPSAGPTDEAASSDVTATVGPQPEWAAPVNATGTEIGSAMVGDVRVSVLQAAVTEATRTGQWSDPDTHEPLIDVGDDIVIVNYVVTNTGEPVDLASLLVSIEPRYDDWQWGQGMDSVVDTAMWTELGLSNIPTIPAVAVNLKAFTLGTGESYGYAENFAYQPGSPITFAISLTPADSDGTLLHDQRLESELHAVIE